MCNRKTTTHTKGLIMTSSIKKYLLIFSLLLSSVQTTQSFWWELFFPCPTTEERVENLKDFCKRNQMRSDEINAITNAARSAYYNNSYHSFDQDQQIAKTIIVDYFTQKVTRTIDTVKQQEFINLSTRNRETVINTYRNQLLDNLSTGKSIDRLVGDTLVASVHQLICNAEAGLLLFPDTPQKPTYNNYSTHYYQQPAAEPMIPVYIETHYQPAPRQTALAYTNSYASTERPRHAKLNVQYLEQELAKLNEQNNNAIRQFHFNINLLSDKDSEQLKDLIENSTIAMENVSADDRLFHTKFALEQFLDSRLECIKNELEPTIANRSQLLKSLEETRKQKRAVIKKLQKVDINTIAELLGDNKATEHDGHIVKSNNIESTVYDNMGIR
jgi:hypothetical protein